MTITNAATLYVDSAPVLGGSLAITNPFAIRVGSGNVDFPGTGNVLGTITSGTWNGTTIAVANGGTGITSFGTGVATFLGTPSSSNLASAMTDETGTGALVFANTPTLVTPAIGAATGTSLALTGTLTSSSPTAGIGYRPEPVVQ